MLLVDKYRKFQKDTHFGGRKIHQPTSKNYEIHLPRWGDPPPNISDSYYYIYIIEQKFIFKDIGAFGTEM